MSNYDIVLIRDFGRTCWYVCRAAIGYLISVSDIVTVEGGTEAFIVESISTVFDEAAAQMIFDCYTEAKILKIFGRKWEAEKND